MDAHHGSNDPVTAHTSTFNGFATEGGEGEQVARQISSIAEGTDQQPRYAWWDLSRSLRG